MIGNLLHPVIEELVKERDFATIKEQLAPLTAADLADILENLHGESIAVVYRLLPRQKATDVFEYLDLESQYMLLRLLRREDVQRLLGEMSVDDRTALLDELPEEVTAQLIQLLPAEDREFALKVLNYPEDSVGRLVTPDYVALNLDNTVAQALEKIRKVGPDKETVYVCYVIGKDRRLVGAVSLRRIVLSPLERTMEELADRNPVTLNVDMHEEEAVDIIRKYDLMALPVLDRDGRMTGIVTFDDLMDVAEEEHREDIDRLAAVLPGGEEFFDERIHKTVLRRVPWLIGLLVVEAAAVLTLASYDKLLEQVIALAFFLPVLTATGGNTGTQSAAMVIRGLATGEVTQRDLLRITGRETVSGLILSVVLGLCAFVLAVLIQRDTALGLCVGLGLAAIVVCSNLAGGVLPLLLKRAGLDPALMSGPFISTLVDVAGLVVYLETSRYVLGVG